MTTISSTNAGYNPYATSSTSSSSAAPQTSSQETSSTAENEVQNLLIGNDSASGGLNALLGLSPNVLELLQGGQGSDMLSTLLGDGASNLNGLFNASLLQSALYASAQKRYQTAADSSPVSDLINADITANTPKNTTATDTTA